MSNRTLQSVNELTDAIIKRMEQRFKGDGTEAGHAPSPDHWRGLREIAHTNAKMALGLAEKKFFYSALPTGMGKTSCCIATVQELCTNHPDVGVLILVNEHRQIESLIDEMGLRDDQYAISVGRLRDDLNSRGVCAGLPKKAWATARQRAQVLFVTQQKLLYLPPFKRDFSKLFPYCVGDTKLPRRVRLWDEAIVPAEALVITLGDVQAFNGSLLARGHKNAALLMQDWIAGVKSDPNGVTAVPNFIQHENWDDEADSDDLMTDENGKAVPASVLYGLQGREVRIHHDEYSGMVMLSFRDYLPSDCAPMMILDASGELRQVYHLWMKGRGDMVPLYSPKKSYRNLTIHHWNRAAGKEAYRYPDNISDLAAGVLYALKQTPNSEPLLIVYHKEGITTDSKSGDPKQCQDLKKAIEEQVTAWGGPSAFARLKFVPYGRHLANNDHRDIRHVCVVGLLQYSRPQNEAMYRAALGASADKPVSPQELSDFRIGEVKHHLFQAVGRGAVRQAKGDDCPEGCHLWLIHSTTIKTQWHTPIKALLDCFPDAPKPLKWEPLGVELKGGALKSKARPKLFDRIVETGGREFFAKELVDEAEGLSDQMVRKALAHVVNGHPKQRELGRALEAQGLRLHSRTASTGKATAALYWLAAA